MFHLPIQQEEAAHNLLSLKQGRRSVTDYAIDFWLMAAKTDRDESALRGTFHNSLSETIKDQEPLRDEPRSLDELIALAIRWIIISVVDIKPQETLFIFQLQVCL